MDRNELKKISAIVLAIYVLLSGLFYWIAGDQFQFSDESTVPVAAKEPVGELVQGMELRQPFTAKGEELIGITLMLSTFSRENHGTLLIQVMDEAGETLGEIQVPTAEIQDNAERSMTFPEPVSVEPGQRYDLVLTSQDSQPGNAVTVWLGNTMSASRQEIELSIADEDKLTVNGEARDGMLHYSMTEREYYWFGQYYWYLAALVGLVLAAYLGYLLHAEKTGRSVLGLRLLSALKKYNYLIRQLISRDFKTKYKRSVLGVLWSFLNPMMTMVVQYIVFSTLFKSDIPNFPLYLLSGIVCFSFFSESTNMALMSIVGNASLITKVYVPKYIYPVTRVFSSTINLLLSLIPLAVVMLFTGTPLKPAILLLPFGLLCLIALSIGVGMILSTMMVFFRDTQFLWGVVIMMWMYATPIFYPESIIGEQFILIFKCNPLYHIIRFIRIILINGVSPEPKAYVLCFLASFIPLVLGAVIFKKNQDKFIMNL